MANNKESDWIEYKRLVLEQLERHENALINANKELNQHARDISVIKWKQYIIGAIFGLVGAAAFNQLIELISS